MRGERHNGRCRSCADDGGLKIPREDYDRACAAAGRAMCAMFAVLTVGCALGWW